VIAWALHEPGRGRDPTVQQALGGARYPPPVPEPAPIPGLPLPYVVVDADGRALAAFCNVMDAAAWQNEDADAEDVLRDRSGDANERDPR
jgi:hypothetical protein